MTVSAWSSPKSAGLREPAHRAPILCEVTTSTTTDTEYRTLTGACGQVDRSERGKLALTGGGAKEFLQGQVSNDVEALTPGSGCYAAFLTPKGKMLGDLRILDTGDELLLDTERIALQELFNMIRRFSIGYDVQLHKRTVQRGLISLVGPDATTAAGLPRLALTEHSHTTGEIDEIAIRAIRTDTGVDLLCGVDHTDDLRQALSNRGVPVVSEAVAECVRIESGRPRYGVDLDDSVIPQEADLNHRAVSFTKGCYVGQETVARLYYRGKPNRQLRGIRLAEPAGPGAEITFGDRAVGRLTSVAESPDLGWIALALVRREAPPGSHVAVGDGTDATAVKAVVVELPFAA